MPQLYLPIFPEGTQYINSKIGVYKNDGMVYYFNGSMPFAQHGIDNLAGFKATISQLIDLELVKQVEVCKTFKVSKEGVKRWVKRYRKEGAGTFYQPKKTRKGGTVLTDSVLALVQSHLNQGKSISEIEKLEGIKADTIRKAIYSGRLTKMELPEVSPVPIGITSSTASARSQEDSQASMGMGCINEEARVEALKKKVHTPEFVNSSDLSNAGVLIALPALINNGIFFKLDVLGFDAGYYSQKNILLTLANCFLLRLKNIEQISHENPGELGKAIGYDRIAEVKTLRRKCEELSADGSSGQWSSQLSKYWMSEHPDLAGVLYIDGHENAYFGKNSKIPRRYFSRLRLALRGTTDYWVNDRFGQPFFSISRTASASFIQVIKDDIVPRLLADVPNQPTQSDLQSDKHLHLFMLVYDREGYSPDFILDMWKKRIACCSYNKYVKDKWAVEEFVEYEVLNDDGSKKETIRLAERAILIQGKESEKLDKPHPVIKFEETENGQPQIKTGQKRTRKKRQLWIREIRRLTDNGHQTSILTSNFSLSILMVGIFMFARWCQENFFKYMVHNLGLDFIISYFTKSLPDTTMVINPAYRTLDKEIRRKSAIVRKLTLKFGKMIYQNDADQKEIEDYQRKRAQLLEDISIEKKEIEDLRAKRKEQEYKIKISDLPKNEKFDQVYTDSKHLVDTIKLIVFRSEMALINIAKEFLSKPNEGHAFMTEVYKANADLSVDYENKTLTVAIHHLSTTKKNEILTKLCNELNKTETVFPDTDLKIIYKLLSD